MTPCGYDSSNHQRFKTDWDSLDLYLASDAYTRQELDSELYEPIGWQTSLSWDF